MIVNNDEMIATQTNCSNIPWQERPRGCTDVVWRYNNNPVIVPETTKNADSIYNSAVVPFNGGFAGVFRVDDKCRNMGIRVGMSKDGVNFEIDEKPISFIAQNAEVLASSESYDPRVCFIEDRYYITWCSNYHGYTIAVAYTYDFDKFYKLENAFLPFNRNGVLFPRRINGRYMMLSRPSDSGHTPFGDIFLSQSPDMEFWGHHRHVMSPKGGMVTWENTKIGAGPVPIETQEGWLIFYHGVVNTCNGFTYSMGAAILEIDEPWKVLYRAKPYLLSPHVYYERIGNTQNVVFPCGCLYDSPTGRIAIYYGCADTVTGLAFCKVDEVLDFVKVNSEL
jgi:beta-1,4-mannooligosaccharide/beta-1,4-mannosyl-N-acetylglucosamine phosphorylase